MKILLTEREAAEAIGFTPRALQDWRRRGGGPRYVRAGRCVRYRPEDLAAWAAERSYGSTSEE